MTIDPAMTEIVSTKPQKACEPFAAVIGTSLALAASTEKVIMAQEEKKTKRLGESRREAWLMLLMVGSSILLYGLLRLGGNVPELPYSEFLARVDRGGVADVVIGDNRIFFESKDLADSRQKLFSTVPVNDPGLPARLQEQHVSFRQQPHSGLGGWLSWALVFFGLYFLIGSFRTGGGGQFRSLLGLTQAKARVYVEHSIKTTFADVAGVDEAKAELNEIAQFLADPERYTRLGGRAPRGILLVGPPGTGKTLLARALAGEAKVPFLSINGSEFVEMFVGLGAARVRDLFEQARKLAPCLLFIDEIDALGRTRMAALPGSNDEKEQTLNQLLAEMDGFDTSAGIIILAATNRPETLDPALLRAGRFDRQVLVNTPDQAGRTHILRVHCRGIVLGQNVSLERIASLTSGFSGADLANLVNEAALLAARRGADAVSETDFTMAVERIVAGLEQRSKHISAEEKRRVAYHEMGHATVALALHSQEHVHKVSVIPRGIGALGYTLQRPTEDRYLMDEDEMLHKIAVLLGGRASEHAFFPTVSTGGADDLTKATEMSRAMVTQYGMSEELGLATFEDRGAPYLSPAGYVTRRPISEEIALQIDHEVKRTLDQAFRMATQAVWQYRTFIEAGVLRLLESETISEEELSVLWQRFAEPRGPSASVGNSPAAKCSAEAPS